MPLKLTIHDSETGVDYVDTVHIIKNIEADIINKKCTLSIAIYANQQAILESKQPITLGIFNRPTYVISCDGAAFDEVINSNPTEEEALLNLSPRDFLRKRVESYIKNLNQPFDFSVATVI